MEQRRLTGKGAATRQRIIEGAAVEVRARGVANTSLDDIRAATATSKSQLFHYFPEGRTQLLLAVAEHEAGRVLADQQPHLDHLTSWPAWQAWRDLVVERYRLQGQYCPLSVLISQLGRGTPETQSVVIGLMERWQARIVAGVRAMRDQDAISPTIDAEQTAAALLAGIQGGVVIMLATGQMTHLEAALDQGIQALRATAPEREEAQ